MKPKMVFSIVNQDVSELTDNQFVVFDNQSDNAKAGTTARGKSKGRTASGRGSKAAASNHNSKIKPNRVSLGDDEKENGGKNGETRKANRGVLDVNLSSLRRSNRSNNQPLHKYKDEEDIEEDEEEEEDEIEEYDSDQASDDDLDHGGHKSKKARM